jgi:hypothetical protein
VQQENDIPGRAATVERKNTIFTVGAEEAQNFRRKSRALEVEWVQDMNKRGFDGTKLLSNARDLIEKHTKAQQAGAAKKAPAKK